MTAITSLSVTVRARSAGGLQRASFLMILLALVLTGACRREDPARAALRDRLAQSAPLSPDELAQVRTHVTEAIRGKRVRVVQNAAPRDMTPEERSVVLGMLTEPDGMFDEGLRRDQDRTFRVLNAPGISDSMEIEATRRLWIDLATLEPGRFQFNYAFPSAGDYAFNLSVTD